VPKTSGQGVSRLGYQKGYRLKDMGAPKVKNEGGFKFEKTSQPRKYAKGQHETGGDINISYGATAGIGQVPDLPDKPAKPAVKDALGKDKKLK
jgi:hypothetical protein